MGPSVLRAGAGPGCWRSGPSWALPTGRSVVPWWWPSHTGQGTKPVGDIGPSGRVPAVRVCRLLDFPVDSWARRGPRAPFLGDQLSGHRPPVKVPGPPGSIGPFQVLTLRHVGPQAPHTHRPHCSLGPHAPVRVSPRSSPTQMPTPPPRSTELPQVSSGSPGRWISHLRVHGAGRSRGWSGRLAALGASLGLQAG